MAPQIYNKTSLGHSELFEGYSGEMLTFAAAACILFIIIGIPGNLLTIIALTRGRQTRSATAVFIINLSFSDLLFGCFNLPLAASTFLRRAWRHGALLCRLYPLMRYGLLAVSLFTVSLITINRYIMIAHPRQYPRIYRHGYLALMVMATWFAAFSIMIPTWQGIWGTFGLDIEIGSCSILPDKNGRSPKEFLFVTAFMVPCICIVICYARIFWTVRRATVRTRETAPPKKVEDKVVTKDNVKKPAIDSKESSTEKPFVVDEDIEFIDMSDSFEAQQLERAANVKTANTQSSNYLKTTVEPQLEPLKQDGSDTSKNPTRNKNPVHTSLKTSFNKFAARKSHYVSFGNTSNASSIYPGKMSQKDRRLLKMILVIFVSFVICYLPITVTKISQSATELHMFNISSYLLVYLTTCINPLIYVLMSMEYRQAYKNLLFCNNVKKKDDLIRNN